MLGFMRKKAGSWLIKIVFGVIVLVFVFWGVGSFDEDRANRLALVNGESIGPDEYRRAYDNYLENLRRQFGDQLSPEMIDRLQVRQQVINGLINQKLVLQEAKKLRLRVSDQELVEAIQGIEMFRSAGAFDNRRYMAAVQQIRMTPEAFEEGQRKDILIDKLRALVTGGVHVSEGEIREWYDYNNATVNIDFVLFSPENYKGIEPTPEDLKAFYEERKATYKTAPEVKVRYIRFGEEDYGQRVTVKEEDISSYYEDFPGEFKSEKTVEARHILIRVDQDAPETQVNEALKKITDVLTEAKSGKDFAVLANTYSEDSSKDTGGYLGTFGKDAMVKPFADQAFSMAAGEISEPVRTQFGWHVIKVEKVNEASVRTLEEAAADIRAKLAKRAVQEMALEAAEAAYDKAFVNNDLEKTATEMQVAVQTTDFFNRNGEGLKLPEAAKIAETAFGLEDGDVGNVLEVENAYYLLQRIETKPEVIPELEAVKAQVRLDVIKKLQEEKATADAEMLLTAVKGGAEMAAEAGKTGHKVQSTGYFKREGMIPEIGFEAQITKAAFELSAGKRFPDSVLKGTKGVYVIEFKERKTPDAEGFAKEKDQIRQTLLAQKEREYFSRWIEAVRAKSDISVDDSFNTK